MTFNNCKNIISWFTLYRLIHQMILMLAAIHGRVALAVGILLGWVVKEDRTDWMLDTMSIKCLMLRRRQYQMKCEQTYVATNILSVCT